MHNRCIAAVPRCPQCGEAFAPGPHGGTEGPPSAELATLRDRLGAQVLDSLFAATFLVCGLTVGEFVAPLSALAPGVGLGTFVAYYLLADGLGRGQSLGKRVTRTAVIDRSTGEPCTFGRSLARNACLMVLGVFDVVFIFGRRRQRLGDRLANTLVVRLSPGSR